MSAAHNYKLFGYFDERRASFSARSFPDQPLPRFERPPVQSAYALSLNDAPDAEDASAAAAQMRSARIRFDEAINLVDHFFRTETGADPWRIHAALNQVHPALVSCIVPF